MLKKQRRWVVSLDYIIYMGLYGSFIWRHGSHVCWRNKRNVFLWEITFLVMWKRCIVALPWNPSMMKIMFAWSWFQWSLYMVYRCWIISHEQAYFQDAAAGDWVDEMFTSIIGDEGKKNEGTTVSLPMTKGQHQQNLSELYISGLFTGYN